VCSSSGRAAQKQAFPNSRMPPILMQRAVDVPRGRGGRPLLNSQCATSVTAEAEVDAAGLFRLGFDAEAVGRALVETRGDIRAALALLRASNPSTSTAEIPSTSTTELATDDDSCSDHLSEERKLQLAIQLSLKQSPTAATHNTNASAQRVTQHEAPASSANPLWSPPRYLPSGGIASGPATLSLVEDVEVRDGGYGWQRARAFLDTGNQHMTIIDLHYAQRHAIYAPERAAAVFGANGGHQQHGWTTLHGVVPGATVRVPVVTIALKIRGEDMLLQVAVSELGHHDLLIGKDVLGRLFASGFRIGTGSM